jgi:signal recognition particle GTPase
MEAVGRASGMRVRDVNDLIKQLEQSRTMMKQMMKAGGKHRSLPLS